MASSWGRRAAGPAAFLLLAAAAGAETLQPAPECRYPGLRVQADFPGARLYGCELLGDGTLRLHVAPEHAPINPSPWYAFELHSEGPRELAVELSYLHARHRYLPKLSHDGERWQALDAAAMKVTEGRARLLLALPAGRTIVAAQPLETHAGVLAWMQGLAASAGLEQLEIGRSVEDRPLHALRTAPEAPQALVFITGRQHPPETTGAIALRHFVERLLAGDALARRFRERHKLVMVPIMNPDGVERGHWRSNVRGVDLNRDWGPFTQPETRAVAAELGRQLAGGLPLAVFLDFHSTRRDTIYSQHPAADVRPAGFQRRWEGAMRAKLGEHAPSWDGGHNVGLATAKNWVHEHTGASALTYEAGDATPPERVASTARIAAETFMQCLLDES